MPLFLTTVLDTVAEADTTADRDQLRRTVLDTIAALGLQVARDGEVYDPAQGVRRAPPSYPEGRNVRLRGRY